MSVSQPWYVSLPDRAMAFSSALAVEQWVRCRRPSCPRFEKPLFACPRDLDAAIVPGIVPGGLPSQCRHYAAAKCTYASS